MNEELPSLEETRCQKTTRRNRCHKWLDGKCINCGADMDSIYRRKEEIMLNRFAVAHKVEVPTERHE